MLTVCVVCGGEFEFRLQTHKNNPVETCSTKCKHSLMTSRHHQTVYETYVLRWKAGEVDGAKALGQLSGHVRRYIFEKFESKCVICGWCEVNTTTGKIPLQVEHIDGDWENNAESNLTLLCPNHHSLTSTYGSLNRGRGRPRSATKGKVREIGVDEAIT